MGTLMEETFTDGYFTHVAHGNNGVFLVALWDVEFGVVAEVELAEFIALVEAHDGVVRCGQSAATGRHLLRHDDVQAAVVGALQL